MLWIFVAVFVISTSINTCESAENLTAIIWQSDVNTLAQLKTAFESNTVKGIEVDVIFGQYKESEDSSTTTTSTAKPDSSSTTSTDKPDSSSTTSTAKPSSTTTTVKPTKPDFNPDNGWDDKWPAEPEDELSPWVAEKLNVPAEIVEPEYPEYNFYKVIPEESWTIDVDATEPIKPYPAVVIDQHESTSNLLFSDFLAKAIELGKTHGGKSIKFNFKDKKAADDSIERILSDHREIKFSVWLHADVLIGPLGPPPNIDGKEFFEQFKKTDKCVLSLGSTTADLKEPKEGYTEVHTKRMKEFVVDNVKKNTDDVVVNFPLRSSYIQKSTTILKSFYDDVTKVHPKITFSIWSAKEDNFDAAEVQNFVKTIGVGNVHLILSDDSRKKLNLGTNGASGLVQFGLLNLITLVVVTIFRNGFH